ncbi:MAG: hypothetical protein GXO74_00235 [Calditrichaeota bacterium]|nr:hypothetical protein [Calditrichota bacterium]
MKISGRFGWALALSAMLLVTLFSCGDRNKRLVARVGGQKISAEDFIKSFARNKKTNQVRGATLEEKKKHLNGMINNALKLIDAYQSKLDLDTLFQKRLDERSRAIMFRRLVEKKVVEKIVPESRVKDYYHKANREVKIRQIVVKFDPNVPDSRSRALQRARAIVRKLKSGDRFDKIAKSESDDAKTASQGGIMGYLKWGPTSYKNPLYVAVFDLKENEISDPIEVGSAFYIVKVVHIKKYPAPPYEQQKEQIKQAIWRVHNREIEQGFYDYLDQLKKKYRLKYKSAVMQMFLDRINQKPSSPAGEKSKPKKLEQRFSAAELSRVIAELSFTTISVRDVVDVLSIYPSHRRPRFRTLDDVKTFLDERVAQKYLLEKEINVNDLKKDPIVKEQVKNFKEAQLIQMIYRDRVSKKLNLTEADYQKYFEEHREDFKNPPMRDVQEIYVNSKEIAAKVVQLARAGRNFTRLFEQYNKKKSLEKNKGKIGFISRGRGGIGKPAFKVKVGGVTDPILIGKGYSIIKVLGEKPATLQSYDEAKRLVQSRLRRIKKDSLEKQWLESLRQRIDVVVYENALKQTGKKYVGPDIVAVD